MKKTSVIVQMLTVCMFLCSALSCSKSLVQPTGNSSGSREAETLHKQGGPSTIVGTNLSSPKPGTVLGTFTATGAFKSSGSYVMLVIPVGTDSIHCELELTATNGTFHIAMDCEKPPKMNGAWKITGGTHKYKFLRGGGTLIMMFPPDVPAGVLSIETMTGIVSRHPFK
jgi:hypothetical protein